MTNDDEGEGGVTIPPKIDDVIYEQPLTERCNATTEARFVKNEEGRILWFDS